MNLSERDERDDGPVGAALALLFLCMVALVGVVWLLIAPSILALFVFLVPAAIVTVAGTS